MTHFASKSCIVPYTVFFSFLICIIWQSVHMIFMSLRCELCKMWLIVDLMLSKRIYNWDFVCFSTSCTIVIKTLQTRKRWNVSLKCFIATIAVETILILRIYSDSIIKMLFTKRMLMIFMCLIITLSSLHCINLTTSRTQIVLTHQTRPWFSLPISSTSITIISI